MDIKQIVQNKLHEVILSTRTETWKIY